MSAPPPPRRLPVVLLTGMTVDALGAALTLANLAPGHPLGATQDWVRWAGETAEAVRAGVRQHGLTPEAKQAVTSLLDGLRSARRRVAVADAGDPRVQIEHSTAFERMFDAVSEAVGAGEFSHRAAAGKGVAVMTTLEAAQRQNPSLDTHDVIPGTGRTPYDFLNNAHAAFKEAVLSSDPTVEQTGWYGRAAVAIAEGNTTKASQYLSRMRGAGCNPQLVGQIARQLKRAEAKQRTV